MSKRVSNKKGRSRKTPARSMVSFGWRKQRGIAMRNALLEKLRLQKELIQQGIF